jgi:hypothetical protein
MFIIVKNNTDDCPGWFPVLTICIIPDQPGLGDLTDRDSFNTDRDSFNRSSVIDGGSSLSK